MTLQKAFGIPRNAKRLTTLAAALLASVLALPANAAVIEFNTADDLTRFNQQQTVDFWSFSETAGQGGGGGLVGQNGKNAGWAVLSQGFAAQTPSVSAGIYFKLIAPDASSSGYSLSFGVASSPTYASTVEDVPGDTGLNHYAATIQYSKPDSRRFRVVAQSVNDGTITSQGSAYQALAYDAWYYLALQSTFDTATGHYSLTATLYDATDGTPGGSLMTITMSDFSNAALSEAPLNYFFFGVKGIAQTRGVGAVDGLTYDVELIPEPGSHALLGGVALIAVAALCRKKMP